MTTEKEQNELLQKPFSLFFLQKTPKILPQYFRNYKRFSNPRKLNQMFSNALVNKFQFAHSGFVGKRFSLSLSLSLSLLKIQRSAVFFKDLFTFFGDS